MPRKSQITMTSRGDAAKSRNAALARRLAGNPFGGWTKSLPLKEPQRWHTYIANTYLDEGAFYDMKQKGWEPLTADDLACPVEESGFRLSPDGYLVRGPQGQEMVFKMDTADHRALMDAKTAHNLQGIGSAKKIKEDTANAAAAQLGSEAADYIANLDGQTVDVISGGQAG